MNDEIIIMDELAVDLISFLQEWYLPLLKERYGLTGEETPVQVLEAAAERRKCYKKGGEPDLSRAAQLVTDDFRSGRLGRISLERP